MARVNKLANDLRTGRVDLPTAVLLNVRDSAEGIVEEINEAGWTMFQPNGHELFVVDGQHRIEALSKLVEENEEKWSSYQVPFVCMLGADEIEEMTQFYVVNSTAKSVRTDLALDLLKQRAENDPNLMASLVEKGEDWKVEGQTIAEELSKTRLWKDRIRFPGDPQGETTIGSAGIVGSLKQILSTPYFGQISTQNRLGILTAYWEGVALVLPDVFRNPTEYGLQKSTGVQIMHSLLISVLELLRSTGQSVLDPEAYSEALSEALLSLEGDTAEGDVARGAEFWLAGVQGAAGSFSSNAGRRVLLARLRTELPEVEVE
jgi:DGQHR domain-containing protein